MVIRDIESQSELISMLDKLSNSPTKINANTKYSIAEKSVWFRHVISI